MCVSGEPLRCVSGQPLVICIKVYRHRLQMTQVMRCSGKPLQDVSGKPLMMSSGMMCVFFTSSPKPCPISLNKLVTQHGEVLFAELSQPFLRRLDGILRRFVLVRTSKPERFVLTRSSLPRPRLDVVAAPLH